MASADDVKKLAALARIEVKDDELEKLSKEFESILAYVGQIETLSVGAGAGARPAVRNVMRADENPHESGAYTEALVAQFPAKKGESLEVKQIISHD